MVLCCHLCVALAICTVNVAPPLAQPIVAVAPSDPHALATLADPMIAAAVSKFPEPPPPSVLDAVLSYLHLKPLLATLPPPPSWIVAIDAAVHSTVLESAWRFAGGDDLGMWVNNLGALSTLAAFSMKDLLMLRYLSIVGQICGITFCFTREPSLWNPIAWQSVFLLVNLCNTAELLHERYGAVKLSREEVDVFERVFSPHGVTRTQFRRLLDCAQWKTVGHGHVVSIEGAAASDEQTSVQLTLVHTGQLAFKSGGETISSRRSSVLFRERRPAADGPLAPFLPLAPLAPQPATDFLGDFVGDTSFFECLREAEDYAAAAAIPMGAGAVAAGAHEQCFVGREADESGRLVTIETTGRRNRLLVWDAGMLRQALLNDVDLRVRMVQVLAWNIASKLEASQDQALAPA